MPNVAPNNDDAEIEEIKRLREVQEIKQLRSQDPWAQAQEGLQGIGGAVMEGVHGVSRAIDRVNPLGASLRSAIGAAQDDKPVGQAYMNQFLRDPDTAPSGKDIAAKLGVPTTEFNTPLIDNPFTGSKFKVSPAGIVGGAAETVLDPTNYIPGELAARGATRVGRAIERLAPRAAEAAGRFAEERAIKAATGENRSAIKKLARVKGQSGGDVDKAMANLRKGGRTLLEADEAGAPAVGWFSNAEEVGRNAEGKRKFFGKEIGATGPTVDRLVPNAIPPQELAVDIAQFQREIPDAGKGSAVRKRVGEEVPKLQRYGLSEEDIGPARPLRFSDAQELKAQYPWEPGANDVLLTDKDASSRINRIISNKMDSAVDSAKLLNPNAEDMAVLNRYGPAKQKYATYKNIADAGTEQALRTQSRRMVSPSSNFIGATGGSAVAQVKDDLAKGGLWGAAMGLVNQQLLERGAAFGAKGADLISKRLMKAPGAYQKWLPTLRNAARGGNAAVLATHHQLMNSDPDYKRLMLSGVGDSGAEE